MLRASPFLLLVAACGLVPAATGVTGFSTTTPATIIRGPVVTTTLAVGDERRPVVVLLAVRGDVAAESVAEALSGAGPAVRIEIVDATEAIQQLCTNPTATVALLPAIGLPFAEQQCGALLSLAAVKSGSTSSRTEFVVKRSSTISGLAGLAGQTWAYSSPNSLPGYLIPSGMLVAAGVVPGAAGPVATQTAVMEAVYDDAAVFGTARFFPSVDGDGVVTWAGDPADADVPPSLVKECKILKDEKVLRCGGNLFPKDARTLVAQEHPDVIEKLKIVAVSPAVHHDGAAFGAQLPPEVATAIAEALSDAAADGVFDGFDWRGLAPGTPEELAALRQMVSDLRLTVADV